MKIMLAAVAFSSGMSGVQRHAFTAVRCLLTRPEISVVHLVVAPWQRTLVQSVGLEAGDRLRVHLAPIDRGSRSRNWWYYRRLPALAAQQRADLVHLTYPAPLSASAYPCPTVVTLHDLYPYEIPANFGVCKVIFNRIILQQCLRNVDAIACVSQTTSLRLGQYVPSQQHKAVRVYNCVEVNCSQVDHGRANGVEPSRPPAERSPLAGRAGAPFLLCVAQHRRNKNIPLLIRTFASLLQSRRIPSEMKLLLVGISGPETRTIQRAIARCKVANRVVLLDGLSECELHWCYARCEALVAPSATEGFGLPVAEALLAGCRVVCSDIPAFREVGDGHARFVPLDARAEIALATAIIETLSTPQRNPVVLPQFSTQVLGAQYLALYRRLTASALFPGGVQACAPERLPG